MKIKTNKEFERDKKKCFICGGTGIDVFFKSKPCFNCSSDVIVVMKSDEVISKEESEELTNDKIKHEIYENTKRLLL